MENQISTFEQDLSEEQDTADALQADADNQVAQAEELSLEELNASLGKKFPSKAAALKSIKDTYSYIGKRQEPIVNQPQGNFVTEESLNQKLFYSSHPEYVKYQDILSKLDNDPAKAVEHPVFKELVTKANKVEEFESQKSVLHSSPRLAKTTDNLTTAREALKAGDYSTANESAVRAVLEAYEK